MKEYCIIKANYEDIENIQLSPHMIEDHLCDNYVKGVNYFLKKNQF